MDVDKSLAVYQSLTFGYVRIFHTVRMNEPSYGLLQIFAKVTEIYSINESRLYKILDFL